MAQSKVAQSKVGHPCLRPTLPLCHFATVPLWTTKTGAPSAPVSVWTDRYRNYWDCTPSGYITNVPSEKMMSQSKLFVVTGAVVLPSPLSEMLLSAPPEAIE